MLVLLLAQDLDIPNLGPQQQGEVLLLWLLCRGVV